VFTSQVIALARWNHWLVAHFRPGMNRRGRWMTAVQGDGAGFPDLILVRPNSPIIGAELKTNTGRVTQAQEAWLEAFRQAGGRGCVWRPNMINEIEMVLK
jgi:hypothetical protein